MHPRCFYCQLKLCYDDRKKKQTFTILAQLNWPDFKQQHVISSAQIELLCQHFHYSYISFGSRTPKADPKEGAVYVSKYILWYKML